MEVVPMFIEKAKLIHGETYDYSKVVYVNNKTKVKIICSKHGEFEQTPDSHLGGCGCKRCGYERIAASPNLKPPQYVNEANRYDTGKFVERAKSVHGGKYGYGLVEYVNTHTKVKITCPDHGEFEQTPNGHLLGRGCRKCSHGLFRSQQTLTSAEFVRRANKIHGSKYDYGTVSYSGTYDKVTIGCPEHGQFEQSPTHHLQGMGCMKCNSASSKQEFWVEALLLEYGVEFVKKDRRTISPLELDFYLPTYGIAIEVNGLRWHSEKFVTSDYHYKKHLMCKEKGVRLIHLYEDEIRAEARVKHYLLSQLRIVETERARKCEVVELGTEECSEFLNKYHLLGAVGSRVKLGLKAYGVLIGVMCFNPPSSSRGVSFAGDHYELTRACFSKLVTGGSAKLFKHFVKSYRPSRVFTYSDNDKFTGSGYRAVGFENVASVKFDYKTVWRAGQLDYRRPKQYSRKSNLYKLFGVQPGTEHEICLNNGVYRIYDSGKEKWEWVSKEQ